MLPAREGGAGWYRSIDNIGVLRQRAEQSCDTSRTIHVSRCTTSGIPEYFVRFISNLLGTALVPCKAVSIEKDISRIFKKETSRIFFGQHLDRVLDRDPLAENLVEINRHPFDWYSSDYSQPRKI